MDNKDKTFTRSKDGVYDKLESCENVVIEPMPDYFHPYFTIEELELMIKLLAGYGLMQMPLIAKLMRLKHNLNPEET